MVLLTSTFIAGMLIGGAVVLGLVLYSTDL